MKLRMPDEELEIGDVAVHGEEVYPSEELALAGGVGAAAERATSNSSIPGKGARKGRLTPSLARRASRAASRTHPGKPPGPFLARHPARLSVVIKRLVPQ